MDEKIGILFDGEYNRVFKLQSWLNKFTILLLKSQTTMIRKPTNVSNTKSHQKCDFLANVSIKFNIIPIYIFFWRISNNM